MSDTATELRDTYVRPLVLDDSAGRHIRAVDYITVLVFSGAGVFIPRFGEICSVQLADPDNSMTIGLPNSHEFDDDLGEPPVSGGLWKRVSSGQYLLKIHGALSYIQERPLTNPTGYLPITNYDAILERPEHQFVYDVAMLEDPLQIEHQLGGFEPVVDTSQWSELQGEEEGQLEVAVELEVSFPPKNIRTVVGTVGARFRAPFETAFSAELAELDGA